VKTDSQHDSKTPLTPQQHLTVAFTMYADHCVGAVRQRDQRGSGRPPRTLERFTLDVGVNGTAGRPVPVVLDILARAIAKSLSPHCQQCVVGNPEIRTRQLENERSVTPEPMPGQAQLPLTVPSTIKTAPQSVGDSSRA
jgi:hypothetical protein